MHLAIVYHYAHVSRIGSGEGSLFHTVHQTLYNGRNETGIDRSADNAVVYNKLAAPFQWNLLFVADIEFELLISEFICVGFWHTLSIRLDYEMNFAELSGTS